MRAPFRSDGVKLLGAFARDRHVAGFFQKGQCRIDDARAGAVPVGGFFLDQLDDLVAVAGRLRDQRQRDEPQIALRQHAAGPHVLGIHAATMTATEAESAKAAAPMASGCPAVSPTISMHFSVLLIKIYR